MMTPPSNPTLLGVDVVMVGTFLAAIATFAVLVAVYAATTVRDPMAKRVKALNERREELKAGIISASSKRRRSISNRIEAVQKVKSALASLKMLQEEQILLAQQKLMQAGIRSKDLAYIVILARFLLPLVIGGTTIVGVYLLGWLEDWGAFKRYGVVAASLIGSYKAPDIFLKNKISKRSAAIRKGIPDALDLLVICAEAGLTVDASFSRVAKELGKAYPELGDEFGLTSIELGFLTERRIAFENLAHRIDLDAIRGVVTTMIQTEKYGTPLASALRVLSAEFRNERMMRAEEKAARLPAIMTVPLILFILPVLFIVAACAAASRAIGTRKGEHET
jgi:tight adherence protein C